MRRKTKKMMANGSTTKIRISSSRPPKELPGAWYVTLTCAALRLLAIGDPGAIEGVTAVKSLPLVSVPVTVTLAPADAGLGMLTVLTLCAVTSRWNCVYVRFCGEDVCTKLGTMYSSAMTSASSQSQCRHAGGGGGAVRTGLSPGGGASGVLLMDHSYAMRAPRPTMGG